MILVFLLYFQDLWPYLQRLVVNGSCLCIRSSVSLTPCWFFFFFTKASGYVQFLQLYKNLTKKILIHTTAWFVFPVQAYFPKYFTMCVTVFVKCMIHVACLPWSLHFCGTVFWSLLHLQQWYSLSVRYWFWFFFNWIHSWLVNCFGFFYSYMLS